MKKILMGLMLLFYLFISFINIKLFSLNQYTNLMNKNTLPLVINNWEKNTSATEKKLAIENIAEKNNINIYKVEHSFDNNINLTNVYSVIGNKKEYKIRFNHEEKNKEAYNLFDNNYKVELHNFVTSSNLELDGTYYIGTSNKNKLNIIREEFSEIGLNSINIKSKSYNSINNLQFINGNLFIILIILDVVISLTTAYFIVSKFKEISIKMLFGYSKTSIIKELVLELFKIYAITFILTLIIISIYLFKYNTFNYYFKFIFYNILIDIIITIVVIVSNLFSCLLLNKINLKNMIKNKKNYDILNYISFYSKIIFTVILIALVITFFKNYLNLKSINLKEWNLAKNYCTLEYGTSYSTNGNMKKYTLQLEQNKKLFDFINNNNGILIAPSIGAMRKLNNLKVQENLDVVQGYNMLYINNNYLKINPLYKINGNEILLNGKEYNNSEDVDILVPEQYYTERQEISKNIETYLNEGEEILNGLYKKYNIQKINNEKYKVNLIFIKNNQKEFLFNTKNNKRDDENAIIFIANNQNLSADVCQNYLMSGFLMPYIGNGYRGLNSELESLGLNQYIVNKPNSYNEISQYIYNLKLEMSMDIIIIISLIIIQIIIIIATAWNDMEKNKRENSIKYIHGYNIYDINYKYFNKILIINIIALVLSLIKDYKNFNYIIMCIFIILICELVISLIVMKLYYAKKIKEILKGN